MIASTLANAELVDVAFDQIRLYGRSSALIVHGLLEVIVVLAPAADEPSRAALSRQAHMIRDASFERFAEPWDRHRIATKVEAAERALGVRIE